MPRMKNLCKQVKRHLTVLVLLANFWLMLTLIKRSTVNPPAEERCQFLGKPPNVSYQYSVCEEERNMPLAFGLTVYTDLERTVRLLRAIHRPHNIYCIHVDKKTEAEYTRLLTNFTRCIGNNIFNVPDSERLDVRWGTNTNLLPELVCARLLLERSKSWKYFINLTGQEFPLKTNWEIVTALLALNGSNVIGGTYKHRNIWRMPPDNYTTFNITYYKSPIHVALRREFVQFMLYDKTAKELLSALMRHETVMRRGVHMDETFFATLYRNPQVFPIPGVSLEAREPDVETFMREKSWCHLGAYCGSKKHKRCICMFGLLDLPILMNSSQFFANKFDISVEPEAYQLLESWISSKMLHEKLYHTHHPSFNRSVYTTSRIAWNHL